jgi:hypothetical protein
LRIGDNGGRSDACRSDAECGRVAGGPTANKLSGQKAKFTKVFVNYNSMEDEAIRPQAVQQMPEVIQDASGNGFSEAEVTGGRDVPRVFGLLPAATRARPLRPITGPNGRDARIRGAAIVTTAARARRSWNRRKKHLLRWAKATGEILGYAGPEKRGGDRVVCDYSFAVLALPHQNVERQIERCGRPGEHNRRATRRVAVNQHRGGQHGHANGLRIRGVIDSGKDRHAVSDDCLDESLDGVVERQCRHVLDDVGCLWITHGLACSRVAVVARSRLRPNDNAGKDLLQGSMQRASAPRQRPL